MLQRILRRHKAILLLLCAIFAALQFYLFSTHKTATQHSVAAKLFKYTRTPNVSVTHSRLLIIIFSSPDEKERRATIRKTWGHSTRLAASRAARVFVVGGRSHSDKLDIEHRDFADILTDGQLIDNYDNLTWKVLSALHWACAQPWQQLRYIAKIDSDNFVNVDVLSRVGDSISRSNGSQWMTGFAMTGKEPLRDCKHKWFVSEKEYPDRLYPYYLNGPHYMMTLEAARKVTEERTLAELTSGRALRMEDVYVTGIVRERHRIPLIQINPDLFIPFLPENITVFVTSSDVTRVFAAGHGLENSDFVRLQKKLDEPEIRRMYDRCLKL